MHFCCNAGSLVSGATPFPEDPTDYYAHPALGFVGCNQLFCRGCNSFVRSVAGLGFALPNMQVDLGALYDRPVLLEAPELAPTYPERRLYLCRCSRWLEQFNRPVFIAEPDPLTDPTMPWMCGGHLVRVLPCDLDGVRVETEADVTALVEKAFTGFAGPTARPKEAALWPARLYALLGVTPAGQIVAEAAEARLADPDPAVRERAIQFFTIHPLPSGVARLLDALEGDRSLLAGELEDAAWRALAQFLDRNDHVLELARKEVLTPGRGRALYADLMAKDGPWMLDHAAEIARANPEWVPALLDAARLHHDDPHAVRARVGA